MDRTIADGGGIPLPVTGCGRRMRLSTSSSSSRDQSRDKTSLTSLTSLTLTAQGFHEWRYVPNNATHIPKTPLKRHGRPIAPRLANNATQAPRPWDGTTNYVSLLPGREMGSLAATVVHPAFLPQLGSRRPGGSLYRQTLSVDRAIGVSPEITGQRPAGVMYGEYVTGGGIPGGEPRPSPPDTPDNSHLSGCWVSLYCR